MELFDAFKIIEARKKLFRNLFSILLIGLGIVFFSSFLVFNGVVIEKAEEIAEENTVLTEDNNELKKENTELKKLIDDGLEKRLKDLEAALSKAQKELSEKAVALSLCNENVNDLTNQLSDCITELQNERTKTGQLEIDLGTCGDNLKSKTDQLEICEKTLVDVNRNLDQCTENLEQCRGDLNRERTLKERCERELEELKRRLEECNARLSQIENQSNNKIGKLERELENCRNSTRDCSEYINQINTLNVRYDRCKQDLEKCREEGNQNTNCDLEVVLAYNDNLTTFEYLEILNAQLDKEQNAGQIRVIKINQRPPRYIKEIKINGRTVIEFF